MPTSLKLVVFWAGDGLMVSPTFVAYMLVVAAGERAPVVGPQTTRLTRYANWSTTLPLTGRECQNS